MFTLESAMDELAYEIGMDPVELRLLNHASVDARGNPWSSGGLAECLRLGAERFGWARRDPAPRLRRDGDWLIGMGMAAGLVLVAAWQVWLYVMWQGWPSLNFSSGGCGSSSPTLW